MFGDQTRMIGLIMPLSTAIDPRIPVGRSTQQPVSRMYKAGFTYTDNVPLRGDVGNPSL